MGSEMHQNSDTEVVEQYQDSGKKIALIGLNFDTESRDFDDWLM